MAPSAIVPPHVEYRIAFLSSDSGRVLAVRSGEAYQMPTISIPSASRHAKELRERIRVQFSVEVLVLDLCFRWEGSGPIAIVEILSVDCDSSLVPVALSRIAAPELSDEERSRIEGVIHGQGSNPFEHLHWLGKVVAWLEAATGRSLSPGGNFEQYNAGYGFCLMRFRMDDGSAYWLKATGDPNRHELAVTAALTKLCGEFLPALVETKAIWNAWITVEDATRLEVVPTNPKELLGFLRKAVEALGTVQIRTAGETDMLLAAGAFDQRPVALSAKSGVFFSYLEEAMAEQRSTHAPRIRRVRLRELCHILEDVCARLDATGLPTTVIHGDMNLGNILVGRSHCQLIDWAEACVGSPVTTLQHLLLLNHVQEESVRASLERDLKNHYRRLLLTICRAEQIDEAFLFMPLIAAFSALYGRGDWLASPLRGDPRRQQYARTLARHIDRAAQEPQLLSILRARRSPCTSDGRANAGRGRNRESES